MIVCLCLMLISGCSGASANVENAGESESLLLKNVQVDVEDVYYKLQVASMDVESEELIKDLLGGDSEYFDEALEEINPDLPNDEYYTLEINDLNYVWTINAVDAGLFFLKGDGIFNGYPDSEQGQLLAYNFVKKISEDIGPSCKENYPAEITENATKYSFFEEYKGVRFMGNTHIALGAGISVDGIIIDVTVDREGIKMVSLNNLLAVTDEIETYTNADFISVDEVAYIADEYGKKMLEISQIDSLYELCGISMIYIPTEEDGEIYWVPGYEVVAEYENEGETKQYCTLIDAFNGYVYQWFSI